MNLKHNNEQAPDTHPLSGTIRRGGIAILVLAIVGVAGLTWARRTSESKQKSALKRAADAGPLVQTLLIGSGNTMGTPMVQGEALPFLSTTIYARTSGFLKEIRVDKGSQVRKGQLLAVIEGRELDQDLEVLKADAENKRRNAERAALLGKEKLISTRDMEQAQADARMAEAKLSSFKLSRSYQEVRAPFDGVITQRFVDPGAMVQNASSNMNTQPIVALAQIDRLRVTVYLDAQMARKAKVGMPVRVSPEGDKGEPAKAQISRLAGTLDVRTRTLLAEVDLENADGRFLPGGAVRVSMGKPGESGITLPMTAIAQRKGKPQVLTVDESSKVHWRPIAIGEDNGQKARVTEGVSAGERVVLNPPPGIPEGALVRVAKQGK